MDNIFDEFEEAVEAEETNKNGNVMISTEVISTIAGIASEETDGVSKMYSSISDTIAEKIGAKSLQKKGVKVEMDGKNVIVDVYVVLKYGVRVREVAENVQENVKNNIETMTGLNVVAVNVRVEGVDFDKKEEKSEEKDTEDLIQEELDNLDD